MNKTYLTIVAGLFSYGVYAQTSLNTAGGNESSSGGTVSFSVGQPTYLTKVGSNGSANEGVQHPIEISVITGRDADFLDLKLSAYPNPTTEYLTLEVESLTNGSLTYELMDESGRILSNKEISSLVTDIEVARLESATYLLKVSDEKEILKTFKIVKVN